LGQGTLSAAQFGRFSKFFAVVALALAASAGLSAIWRARQDRRFLVTGSARWIWYTREIREPRPLRFRAWKDFRLDGASPAAAPARLFGDRDWALDVNGERVASGTQKPGEPLTILDLARFLRTGQNRISIEAASPNGVGGLLFWMDLGERGTVVSDGTWEVERLPAGGEPKRPALVWGRPPMYPWGYPALPE
jgi:hypothetical protein